MAQQQETHPLSFLAAAFDAKKYPNISVSFGKNRIGEPMAWVKQARPANGETPLLPDVFHRVSVSKFNSFTVKPCEAGRWPDYGYYSGKPDSLISFLEKDIEYYSQPDPV